MYTNGLPPYGLSGARLTNTDLANSVSTAIPGISATSGVGTVGAADKPAVPGITATGNAGAVIADIVSGGGVEIDAVGTKRFQSANTSFSNATVITVDAGNALVVVVNFGYNNLPAPTSVSCTWDGTPMTLLTHIDSSAGYGSSYIYGLRSPAAGANVLALSWTNSAEIFVDAISFTGVNITSDAMAFPVAGRTTQDTLIGRTVDVVSATDNYVVAVENSLSAGATLTGTVLFNDQVNGLFINCGVNYDVGAATVTIGEATGTTNVVIAAVDVSAVGVTVNATDPSATGTYQALGASMTKSDFTVAAGTDTVLVCTLIRASAALDVTTGTSVIWDSGGTNQAMTLLKSQQYAVSPNYAVEIWGLRAPTVGNKTLAVAWTNAAADNMVSCIAFDHVDQTSDAAAFPLAGRTGDFGTIGVHDLAVPSVSGNMVVVALNQQVSGAAANTTFVFDNHISGSLINACAVYKQSVTTSTTAGVNTGGQNSIASIDVQHS